VINTLMKRMGERAYWKDLDRIDSSRCDSSVNEIKDISYTGSNSDEHKLDIYYVSDNREKPVFIDIHGGGFISGDKKVNSLFANYLAQRGLVVFTLNYRLAYPTITVFDQIEDVASAVRWIVAHARAYEGNIKKMYISGHSAGGVLAIAESLLCNDNNMRTVFNMDDRTYKYNGIILDCGAMHFYRKSIAYWGMRNMIFPKGYQRMEKYQYLVFENNSQLSTLPRTVLLTNENDELKDMSYYFKRVLDDYRVDNKLIDIGTDGHTGILFHTYTSGNQRILDCIQDFFSFQQSSPSS